jgi:hypothetical protein
LDSSKQLSCLGGVVPTCISTLPKAKQKEEAWYEE